MGDDQRVYSDEEFALILKQAADLASRTEQASGPSGGLTLSEIKSAAAQAGFDPAIVERAAQMLGSNVRETPIERLLGGPLQHKQEIRIPLRLDEQRAAQLLSAIRITAARAGATDVGHSSAMGLTWHDGNPMEALGVIARPERDGTAISVSVDRRGTLVMVGVFSGMALFLALLFSMFGLSQTSPALGIGGAIVSVGGVFAIARGFWASSTRRLRERIGSVMEAISQSSTPADPDAPRKLEPPGD